MNFPTGGLRGGTLTAGALAAAFGGGAAAFPQGFTSGLGQIPAGAAIPGLLAGGIALATAPSYVAGVALTLTPDGLTPIAAFPPFEKPRTVEAVAVTFMEEDQIQLRLRRKTRSINDFSKVPSKSRSSQTIEALSCVDFSITDYVYYAYDDFKPIGNEGIDLHKGEKIQVIDWSDDDWWFVTKESSGLDGWVPANYLIEENVYKEQKLIKNKVSSLPITDGKILDVLICLN